jgi:anti-sigma-K factor RskA
VVSSARSITDEDRPSPAPPQVWTAITSELGMETPTGVTPITSARSARGNRGARTWLVAAAAAVVGVLAGGVVATSRNQTPDTADLLARAELGPMDESGFTGTARVEQGSDGTVLTVAVPDLPGIDDGYYEVWMATADAGTMVAIGTLNPGQEGHYPLPAGMDVGSFPVVDVSVEHFDGEAGHSATSVVRGQLEV